MIDYVQSKPANLQHLNLNRTAISQNLLLILHGKPLENRDIFINKSATVPILPIKYVWKIRWQENGNNTNMENKFSIKGGGINRITSGNKNMQIKVSIKDDHVLIENHKNVDVSMLKHSEIVISAKLET